MAEYIEREELVRRFELTIKSLSRDCNSNAPIRARTYEEAMHRVEKMRAADVVPVVRCKDCKFYEKVEYYHPTEKATKSVCRLFKRQMQPDDYCSYGERRI